MKKLLTLTLIIFSFSTFAVSGARQAAHPQRPLIVNDINRVYDGDTFFINVDQWPAIIGDDIGIRVSGMDTPEISSRCKIQYSKDREKSLAIAARDYAEELLTNAKRVELRSMKRGSRFRIVADVYIDGKNMADIMIINFLLAISRGWAQNPN